MAAIKCNTWYVRSFVWVLERTSIGEFRKQTDYISIVFIHTESARAGALVRHSVSTIIFPFFRQSYPAPRALQVLSGHDRTVSCVALSLELDAAASGSEDGSVNVYAAREGTYLRTLRPFAYGDGFVVSQMSLSPAGHLVRKYV